MEYRVGVVNKVVDGDKFIVKFTIDNYIEDAIAYPIDTFDEPNVGDPILVYAIEDIMGWCFMYKKQRLANHTRMKLGKSTVDITNKGVRITTDKGNDVIVNSDGDITIECNDSIKIKSKSDIRIQSGGNLDVKADGDISLKGSSITSKNKTVSPTGEGPFCAIKVCPYTGAPHVGNIINP